MFALIPVNLSLYWIIKRAPNALRPPRSHLKRAISLLVFTAAVFRSEVLLLLGPLSLQALFAGNISFSSLLRVGLTVGLMSAALTICIDSYFWQQWPLWPELYGLYFNVVQGKSSEWGVSPFHTYFTSYLPKLLLSSLPLSVIGFLLDSRIRGQMFPALIFLMLISGLGHKEWRFVVYVVPVFNVAAARGAAWMISRRKGSLFGRVCFLVVAGSLASNCVITYLLMSASMANYPGGEALSRFNKLYAARDGVHVHISNLAAQTGASLFLQTHASPFPPGLDVEPIMSNWVYNKTEHLSPQTLAAAHEITHVIAESESASTFSSWFTSSPWITVDTVDGFDRWSLNPGVRSLVKEGLMESIDVLLHPLEMQTTEKLVILEKKGTEASLL